MNRFPRRFALGWTATVVAVLLTFVPIGATAQIYTLPRVDANDGDFFGVDVAIDGDRVLVGATGVDTCGENSGAAYVYERDRTSGRWRLGGTLTPTDCEPGIFFGRSIDLSGNTAVVAAFRTTTSTVAPNSAYVFERDSTDGSWKEVKRLRGDPDTIEGPFAADVAMDGGRILVTTAGDLSDGEFGGAAYIYEQDRRGDWQRTARLTASGDTESGVMGGSAAIDGNRVIVSASKYFKRGRGSVYVFDYDEADRRWQESARLDGFEDFFIATDVDENRIIVGESKAGAESEGRATVFVQEESGRWRREVVLRPAYPFSLGAFGSGVAIEDDRALVVGYDEQLQFEFNIDRVVYVFDHHEDGDAATAGWAQKHIIDIGNVYFGSSIDVDRNVAAIGQASDAAPGSVVIVQLN